MNIATKSLVALLAVAVQYSRAGGDDLDLQTPAEDPSAEVAGNQSSPEESTPRSCTVDTSDIGEPLTAGDIQTLMTKYGTATFCAGKFRSALERTFAREDRDEQWAGAIEKSVRESALVNAVKMKGECHASLCRYDVEATPDQIVTMQNKVDRPIIASVKDTKFEVEAVHFVTPTGYMDYFYSTVVPAAFVAPLRKLMDSKPQGK